MTATPISTDAGTGDAILAAYKNFDYHRCGEDCGGEMREQAGIRTIDHVNPKSVIKNPAPARQRRLLPFCEGG